MTKQKMYALVFVWSIIAAAVILGIWLTPIALKWWERAVT